MTLANLNCLFDTPCHHNRIIEIPTLYYYILKYIVLQTESI